MDGCNALLPYTPDHVEHSATSTHVSQPTHYHTNGHRVPLHSLGVTPVWVTGPVYPTPQRYTPAHPDLHRCSLNPSTAGLGAYVLPTPQRYPHPGITPGPGWVGYRSPPHNISYTQNPLTAWNHSAYAPLRWTHTTRSRVRSGSAPIIREGLHRRVFIGDTSAGWG